MSSLVCLILPLPRRSFSAVEKGRVAEHVAPQYQGPSRPGGHELVEQQGLRVGGKTRDAGGGQVVFIVARPERGHDHALAPGGLPAASLVLQVDEEQHIGHLARAGPGR